MPIKNFEDLEIWKDARHLTRQIYTLSMAPQFSKDFALRDQMRRAAELVCLRVYPRNESTTMVYTHVLNRGGRGNRIDRVSKLCALIYGNTFGICGYNVPYYCRKR
ncbi:MAG TPA: four helix bundle protein [Candidatus Binatia bacterium]|jgi:hypothetical protein